MLAAVAELNPKLSSYIEPIIIPDDEKSTLEETFFKVSHFGNGCYLKLFPNPAKQYVIAEYKVDKKIIDQSDILLSITSIEGKNLQTRILDKLQDQVLIDASEFKTGTYLCAIKAGGKVLASRTFLIVK